MHILYIYNIYISIFKNKILYLWKYLVLQISLLIALKYNYN